MKKLIIWFWVLSLAACDAKLDEMRPHNQSDAETYLNDFQNIVSATSGAYSLFDSDAGGFDESNGNINRVYHMLGEFRGNNIIFNEGVTDADAIKWPDLHFYLDSDQKSLSMAWPLWASVNQLILMTSKNIAAIDRLYEETLNPTEKEKLLYLKGDNLFLRGLGIFIGTNVFGRPYWDEPSKNPGLPLDLKGEGKLLPRETVEVCFQQALADFRQTLVLLPHTESFNRTYANRAAAFGLISKIYLYMGGLPESPNREYNKLAVSYADSVFSFSGVEVYKGENFKQLYLIDAKTNKEILYAHSPMNYPSPLTGIRGFYNWILTEGMTFYNVVISRDYEAIMDKSKDVRWKSFVTEPGRHPGRYTTRKYDGGEYIIRGNWKGFAAPVIYIRAGEVLLNRAEAYAKLGDARALDDLNVIKERAGLETVSGLSGMALFNEIFLERRREMAFEADVFYDYVRNGIVLERNETTIVYPDYVAKRFNRIDPKTERKTAMKIPYEELLLNDRLIQNN